MSGLEGMSVENIQALAELAQNLSSNPKTRHGFLNLTKLANPDTAIPEIDIPANISRALEAPLKQLDALTAAHQKREIEDGIEAKRRSMIRSGVPADDVDRVEKLMVEKGIANHETALEHMRMQERAAVPTPASSLGGIRKFDTPKLPDLKAFNGDQKAYSYSVANQVIDELRGRKAAA